ncbi:hypothetical protein U1Q18_040324, partial [Sarracenia purpurea var. burkii]
LLVLFSPSWWFGHCWASGMAELGASVAAVGFSKHGGTGVLFLGLLWLSAASV